MDKEESSCFIPAQALRCLFDSTAAICAEADQIKLDKHQYNISSGSILTS